MIKKNRLTLWSFFSLLFLLFSLGVLTYQAQNIQIWWQEATGQPADIVVDSQAILGPLPHPWQAFSQGGEEEQAMIHPVVEEVKYLQPKYIRIDHVFDGYNLVSGNKNGQMNFDFEQLDETVKDILATNALPFFSLSYMPPVIARDGQVTSPPENWSDWSILVKVFIEHYSGKNNFNLNNVYYEVWNEPDLFGGWKIRNCYLWEINCNPEKDYRKLYFHSIAGARQAQNTNSFFIGGPATTGYYPAWIEGLFELSEIENLPLDFISWHRYHLDIQQFLTDLESCQKSIEKYPRFYQVKKIVSEWGSDPGNSPIHDSIFDAAHAVAVTRYLLTRADLAFSFEIKDGPDPENRKYWGRWGILTHQNFGKEKKPRYYAFDYLNRLGSQRLSLSGEGSWVKGIATKENDSLKILLVNYDPQSKHQESFPLTITNLQPGNYTYQENFLLGKEIKTQEIVGDQGIISKNVYLAANTLVLIEITPSF